MAASSKKIRIQDLHKGIIVRFNDLPSTKAMGQKIEGAFSIMEARIEKQHRNLKKTNFSANSQKKEKYNDILAKSQEFTDNLYELVIEKNSTFDFFGLARVPYIFDQSFVSGSIANNSYSVGSWLAPIDNIENFNEAMEELIKATEKNITTAELNAQECKVN